MSEEPVPIGDEYTELKHANTILATMKAGVNVDYSHRGESWNSWNSYKLEHNPTTIERFKTAHQTRWRVKTFEFINKVSKISELVQALEQPKPEEAKAMPSKEVAVTTIVGETITKLTYGEKTLGLYFDNERRVEIAAGRPDFDSQLLGVDPLCKTELADRAIDDVRVARYQNRCPPGWTIKDTRWGDQLSASGWTWTHLRLTNDDTSHDFHFVVPCFRMDKKADMKVFETNPAKVEEPAKPKEENVPF